MLTISVLTIEPALFESFSSSHVIRRAEELRVLKVNLIGGELPAQVMMDSIARLLPGVLKEGSAREESFEDGLMEYPQYTKPQEFQGKRVPDVLLSGNHEEVRAWRERQRIDMGKTEVKSNHKSG